MGITEKNVAPVSKIRLTALSVLGVLLAVAAVALAVINPLVLMARKNTRIGPGSPVLQLLKGKLHGVQVETFLFNITNAERFLSGQDYKLKVEEIGPFTYIESRINEDLELDEEAGVLRYTPRTNATFNPDKSIGDPAEINVTMPNIAFLSMASMLSAKSSFYQVPFTLLARSQHSKSVITTDADTYMWGYQEPLIRLGHKVVPGWINFDKMGIMDRLYDPTLNFRLEVGIRDEEKFRIHTINGLGGMQPLGYEDPSKRSRCNTFVNTFEGLGYPPGISPETEVRIWRNVMCRILETQYVETRVMDYGAPALVFTLSNRTYDYNPDKQCLCEKGACYNGMSDLSPCFMGLPLAISNAHFLGGEPRLFRRVEGLKPNEKDHGSQFLIEPTTGVVLGTKFTVQMNIVLNDVSFNNDAAPFSDMVLPIAYFKISQQELPDKTKSMLKVLTYYGPKVMLGVEILLLVAGLVLVGWCWRRAPPCTPLCAPRAMAFPAPSAAKPASAAASLPLMETPHS